MTDLIAGVLIIVLLGAIIRFMVRPQRPSPDTASISTLGTLLNGLLAAAALGVTVQGVANGWGSGLTSGAVVGLLFGLLSGAGPWKEAGISLVLTKPFTRRELAASIERALGRPING